MTILMGDTAYDACAAVSTKPGIPIILVMRGLVLILCIITLLLRAIY